MVWGAEDGDSDSTQFTGIRGKGAALFEVDKHR